MTLEGGHRWTSWIPRPVPTQGLGPGPSRTQRRGRGTRSGYQHRDDLRLARPRALGPRAIRHVLLTGTIHQIHAASNSVYGVRRVHAELTLGRGMKLWHGTVAMLMSRAGLKGVTGRPKWRRARADLVSAYLVDRQFNRQGLDQLWVTDITEYPTREGKVYCTVVLDMCSRRVVGWAIDSSPTAALTTNALGMAIDNREPNPGTVIHSDHGVLGSGRGPSLGGPRSPGWCPQWGRSGTAGV